MPGARWAAHPEIPYCVCARRWEERLLSTGAWYGVAQAEGPVVESIQWAAEADLAPWQDEGKGTNMLTHLHNCHRCRIALYQAAGMVLWLGTCVVAVGLIVCGDPSSLWFHAAGIYCAGSAGVALGMVRRLGKAKNAEEESYGP